MRFDEQGAQDDELFDRAIWQSMQVANSKGERVYWARKLGENFARITLKRIEAAWDAAGLTKANRATECVVLP